MSRLTTLGERFAASTALRYKLGVLGIGALAAFPLVVANTPIPLIWIRTLTVAFFFGIFAMSWDVLSGYTGQISFGHALFFAIGGYTSTLLNLEFGITPALSITVGVVLSVLVGLLIGVPALRLSGPYLGLVTLVAPLILLQIFTMYSDTFGGELGLRSPQQLLRFDDYVVELTANYYFALVVFLAVLAVLWVITRSDTGKVFTAIREDEEAVAAAGLNTTKFKIFAFALSAAVGGFGGAVFVHSSVGSTTPGVLLDIHVSIEVVIATILGGMGTIVGAAIGGILLVVLQDFLDGISFALPLLGVEISAMSFAIFGTIALAMIFYMPRGLLPASIDAGRRALDRRRADRAVTDGGTDESRGGSTDDAFADHGGESR
ncbi:branched-chain amino acid ABC transporter permease [Natronobeatus ordinarius]|uniref:branched-chain amino acid ABC transporter permease n=1 Tax=Natronobeatus ordinarius TaxID=2963433 RepID=UPI0020CE7F24|nr:branched-chain amino acid ABC transporter permease [Natronobeatus ordinarius]